jgi:hypothetical protein
MDAVTPETCSVTLQWINVCVLLHQVGSSYWHCLWLCSRNMHRQDCIVMWWIDVGLSCQDLFCCFCCCCSCYRVLFFCIVSFLLTCCICVFALVVKLSPLLLCQHINNRVTTTTTSSDSVVRYFNFRAWNVSEIVISKLSSSL